MSGRRLVNARGVRLVVVAAAILLVTVAANPKAAVFAFSFFPQFLPRHGPVFGTTVALGLVQIAIDTTYCTVVVLLAARARRWLSRAAVRAGAGACANVGVAITPLAMKTIASFFIA